MSMELLQCHHLEQKLKLTFAHTVTKLGSPVSSKVLVVLSYFFAKFTHTIGIIQRPQCNIIKTNAGNVSL